MADMLQKLSFLTLTNPETQESLVLSPSLGGTIVSLTLGSQLHQILENDAENELQKNPLFRGRFLFPFNDRIPNGKYAFKGKNYQIAINCSEDNSAIHGFIYNKELTIIEQTLSSVKMKWNTEKNKFLGYPFDISLLVEISLHNKGVTISFIVKNEGNIPAPFALGWHSYFKTDEDSTLHADYTGYFETDKDFLPVGDSIPTTGSKFEFSKGKKLLDKNLDHTFLVPANRTTILKNSNYNVKIKQENFAYTQLFIPPDRKSIAIEPISSKPNSFNSGEVLVLEPGEEYKAEISINLTLILTR